MSKQKKPTHLTLYIVIRLQTSHVPVVRAFVHGAMARRIDPSWLTHSAISRSSQCSTTGVTKAVRGMCYAVCGIVHIKEPLLLIGKSRPFLSVWSFTICPTTYNRK